MEVREYGHLPGFLEAGPQTCFLLFVENGKELFFHA